MKSNLLFFAIACFVLASCEDSPPEVLEVPTPEVPDSKIDQYYYVQFAWGKGQAADTITMEVPDDTTEWVPERDYMNDVLDIRNEVVWDTANAEELDPEEIEKTAWHYAPSSIFYPRDYIELTRTTNGNPNPEELAEVYNGIFRISFPWYIKKDTIQFWDIQDYLDHPMIAEGDVPWGRVGNNDGASNLGGDSLWNIDGRTGVMMSYLDENGELWESDNDPTFQPFGYFVIRKVITNHRDDVSYNIIEGECAARLYSEQGYYKELRGGKFRVRILNDIELSPQPE